MRKWIAGLLILVSVACATATYSVKNWQGIAELETYINTLGYDVEHMIGLNGFQGSYIILSKAGGTDGTIGQVTFDEGYTVTPIVRTSGTAYTSPNAIVAPGTRAVIVTSAHADNFIYFPAAVLGHKIDVISDQTNGFEIRFVSGNNVNATAIVNDKELAVPAGSIMHATCTVGGAAGYWVITQSDGDGTTDAGGTPD